MVINKIKLNNFGSYEGEVTFNAEINNNRNIILVGGKNGAGKTTLFTAIRLCLYGYMSMGYKAINSHYNKAIIKLINNTAKMQKPATACVELEISLSNGHEYDIYSLCRKWKLDENLEEFFVVTKNGECLDEKSVADFEKYMLTLIPPELFDLYFFDGEKIADYFMDEGGNTRIKEAFLTLCGYDTFEIMRKNFKRINDASGGSKNLLDDYLNANEVIEQQTAELTALTTELEHCIAEISDCESEISALDLTYSKEGGITQEEYNKKTNILREEEKKREQVNALLKRWANDIVPFVMIRDSVAAIKEQLLRENDSLKYRYFCEVLDSLLQDNFDLSYDLKTRAAESYQTSDNDILGLSFEQKSELLAQINKILDFDFSKIEKYKKGIKKSILFSSKIRTELESGSISDVQEYMQKKADLLSKKSECLGRRLVLEKEVIEKELELKEKQNILAKAQQLLEDELKKQSINDISAKAIVMLDKLQKVLYRKQISKVEKAFRKEITILIRKTKFIDDINIDDKFNIHIYRNEVMSIDDLCNTISSNTEQQIIALWGRKALDTILDYCKTKEYKGCENWLRFMHLDSVIIPIEIDKSSFSAGEKQIFIMALYHSLISLCNNDIPFIIDTPFARIDTEHRRNISKHFFCKLKGQVFILSTDEEIDSEHVHIMNDKILATYILENQDNKRTTIVSNCYFEED